MTVSAAGNASSPTVHRRMASNRQFSPWSIWRSFRGRDRDGPGLSRHSWSHLNRAFGGGSRDGFVTELAPNGSDILYSTFLKPIRGRFVHRRGKRRLRQRLFATGKSDWTDFPVADGVFQPHLGGPTGECVRCALRSMSRTEARHGVESQEEQNCGVDHRGDDRRDFSDPGLYGTSGGPPCGFGIDALKSTCVAGGSIAAGKSCKVAILFSPAAKGEWAAALQITGNMTNPGSIGLSGAGR